jgi:hypothetical protein
MMKGKHDRRTDVLEAARRYGWEMEHKYMGEGNDVVLDVFTRDVGQIRCVWIRTPWTSGGRYAGAIFSSKTDKKDINLWRIEGNDKSSLLHTLRQSI